MLRRKDDINLGEAEKLFNHVKKQFVKKNYLSAIRICNDVIRQYEEVLVFLPASMADLIRYIKEKLARTYSARGAVYTYLNSHAGAIADYLKAASFVPHETYYLTAGHEYASLVQQDKSNQLRELECYTKAIQQNPNAPFSYLVRGYLRLKLGKKTSAMADLKQFLVQMEKQQHRFKKMAHSENGNCIRPEKQKLFVPLFIIKLYEALDLEDASKVTEENASYAEFYIKLARYLPEKQRKYIVRGAYALLGQYHECKNEHEKAVELYTKSLENGEIGSVGKIYVSRAMSNSALQLELRNKLLAMQMFFVSPQFIEETQQQIKQLNQAILQDCLTAIEKGSQSHGVYKLAGVIYYENKDPRAYQYLIAARERCTAEHLKIDFAGTTEALTKHAAEFAKECDAVLQLVKKPEEPSPIQSSSPVAAPKVAPETKRAQTRTENKKLHRKTAKDNKTKSKTKDIQEFKQPNASRAEENRAAVAEEKLADVLFREQPQADLRRLSELSAPDEEKVVDEPVHVSVPSVDTPAEQEYRQFVAAISTSPFADELTMLAPDEQKELIDLFSWPVLQELMSTASTPDKINLLSLLSILSWPVMKDLHQLNNELVARGTHLDLYGSFVFYCVVRALDKEPPYLPNDVDLMIRDKTFANYPEALAKHGFAKTKQTAHFINFKKALDAQFSCDLTVVGDSYETRDPIHLTNHSLRWDKSGFLFLRKSRGLVRACKNQTMEVDVVDPADKNVTCLFARVIKYYLKVHPPFAADQMTQNIVGSYQYSADFFAKKLQALPPSAAFFEMAELVKKDLIACEAASTGLQGFISALLNWTAMKGSKQGINKTLLRSSAENIAGFVQFLYRVHPEFTKTDDMLPEKFYLILHLIMTNLPQFSDQLPDLTQPFSQFMPATELKLIVPAKWVQMKWLGQLQQFHAEFKGTHQAPSKTQDVSTLSLLRSDRNTQSSRSPAPTARAYHPESSLSLS